MNEQSQDLKEVLLQTDEEFHDLAAKHHELEDRLHELTAKHYLSEPEQLEEVTLKKRKLQLKDRMEDILPAPSASHPSRTQLRHLTRARARSAAARFTLCRRSPSVTCASIPRACRSSAARCAGAARRRVGGWLLALAVRAARAVLRRSSSAIPNGASPAAQPTTTCCRRPTAACWSPAPRSPTARRRATWQQVSIFLSPMDVHVNRIPASGRVTACSYTPGRFLPAYRHDAATHERAQRDLDRSRRPDGRRAADRRHAGAPRRLPRCRSAPRCAPATGSAS